MTNTETETKAQRVERLKHSKNPWEGLEEIRRFARDGLRPDLFVGHRAFPVITLDVTRNPSYAAS